MTHLNQNLDQIILRVRAKRELELKTDPPNNITENLEEISSPELVNRKYFFLHIKMNKHTLGILQRPLEYLTKINGIQIVSVMNT